MGKWRNRTAHWTDEVAPILRIVADLGFDGAEVSPLGLTDDRAAAWARLIRDISCDLVFQDGPVTHPPCRTRLLSRSAASETWSSLLPKHDKSELRTTGNFLFPSRHSPNTNV